MAAAEELADGCRRLAAGYPDHFMFPVDLAGALQVLATARADAGLVESGVAAATEAVDILDRQSREHGFLLSNWAEALAHRGELFSRSGEWIKALLDIGTAVIYLHILASRDPAVHQDTLTSTMVVLRAALSTLDSQPR